MSEYKIPTEHLKMEPWPPVQKGGQHVGSPRGLRVEHIPSGLVVIVDYERSQHMNKAIALDMIMGGLTSPHFRGNKS